MTQDPASRRTILRLFEAALDVSADARGAWLDERCGDRPDVAAAVLELLEEADTGETLLPLEVPRSSLMDSEESILAKGTRIAGFTIEALVGSGGMGQVYDARQDQPRRRVALKVLHAGRDGTRARRRFALEAELLANLQHPAIAQVHDAGVARIEEPLSSALGSHGAPPSRGREVAFLAMEFLSDARTLTDAARDLDRNARLRLFQQVCRAVEHGHQRGIIHRDLKPANVLVDAGGRPRVIDYGVALAHDAELDVDLGEATLPGTVVGTPTYMAPEQLELSSTALDTRVDVYALGALLYELCLGRPPFELSGLGLARALRTVAEETPPAPRSLDPELSRDLDAILRKALHRDREGRYGSAGALAEDIERYLRHETVDALRPGLWHQLRLFARRQRALVSGVGTAAIALLAATLLSLRFARDAKLAAAAAEASATAERASRERAETYLGDLIESNLSIVEELAGGLARTDGGTRARTEALRAAVERLEAANVDAVGAPALLETTARAYLILGNALGGPMHDNVGDRDGASRAYDRAQALLERVPADAPTAAPLLAHLARARCQIAWAEGRTKEALELSERALAIFAARIPTRPFDWELEREHVSTLSSTASLHGTLGRHEKARELFRERLRHVQRMLRAAPEQADGFELLQNTRVGLATSTWKADGAASAVALYREVLDAWDAAATEVPQPPDTLRQRILQRGPFTECLIEAGRYDEAIAEADIGLKLYEELQARDPGNRRLASSPMLLYFATGQALLLRGRSAIEAESGPDGAVDAEADLALAEACFEEARRERDALEQAGLLRAAERDNAKVIEARLGEVRALLERS